MTSNQDHKKSASNKEQAVMLFVEKAAMFHKLSEGKGKCYS
jgi:hypothetical protein